MDPNLQQQINPIDSVSQGVAMPSQEQEVDSISPQEQDKIKALLFAAKNKTEIIRQKILTEVFEELQSFGVDLADQQSVNDFIIKLKESSPELAQNFENAMNSLLGGEDQNVINPQNMNNQNPNENETLPQEIQ